MPNAARAIIGCPPIPLSASSNRAVTRAPSASAYSRARASASAIAACRASRYAGLSGRSDHHGPATSTWSWSAKRSISSPSAVKSVTVTVVPTLPWYATTRSPERFVSGHTRSWPVSRRSTAGPAESSSTRTAAARSASRVNVVSRSRSRAVAVTVNSASSGATSRYASPRTATTGASAMPSP